MARTLTPDTVVYCRFTGTRYVVVNCNGCVAILRDPSGYEFAFPVGEITRTAP